MQAELESIRTGYETLKLTPEQIAEDRNLTVEAVKAALLNCSPAYRRDAKAEPKDDSRLNFSDDQLVHINEEIFRLAIYAEDENVRTKNCHYLRDDKKGRKEIRNVLGGNTFNILAFNQTMQRAREGAERMKMQVVDCVSSSGESEEAA